MRPPYYADDTVTLYHGDCREILPELRLRADLVVTDPPYGIGYASSRGEAVLGDADFTQARESAALWPSIVPVVVFASHASLGRTYDLVASMRPRVQVGTWRKSNVNGAAHGGMWWSDVEFFVAGMHRTPRVPRSAVVSAPKNTGNPYWQAGNPDAYLHPTQKPTGVLRHILGSFPEAGHVLDPFAGSGSTLLAARDLGLRATGIEIDEAHCETTARRFAQPILDFGESA